MNLTATTTKESDVKQPAAQPDFTPHRFRPLSFRDQHTTGGISEMPNLVCDQCCMTIAPGENAAVVDSAHGHLLVHERCIPAEYTPVKQLGHAMQFVADLMRCPLKSPLAEV